MMETTGASPERLLQEAIKVAEVGDLDAARRLLAQALQRSPDDVQAWSLACRLAASPGEEAYCLKRVLEIDPGQAWAGPRLRQLALEQTGLLAAVSAEAVVQAEDTALPSETTPPPQEAIAQASEAAAALEPATRPLSGAPSDEPLPLPVSPDLAPAATPVSPTTPARARASRRRRADPVFVFLLIMAWLFAGVLVLSLVVLMSRLSARQAVPVALAPLPPGTVTVVAPLNVAEDCQAVIARALQAAEIFAVLFKTNGNAAAGALISLSDRGDRPIGLAP